MHWNTLIFSTCKPSVFPLSEHRSRRCSVGSVRSFRSKVSSSMLGDFNVFFDFPLIHVAIALNTRIMEHLQREGGVKGAAEGTSTLNFTIGDRTALIRKRYETQERDPPEYAGMKRNVTVTVISAFPY